MLFTITYKWGGGGGISVANKRREELLDFNFSWILWKLVNLPSKSETSKETR